MPKTIELRKITVVNCTAHSIHILDPESYMYHQVDPKVKATFEPSGHLARVTYKTELLERILVDNTVLDITSTHYGDVIGLPEPVEGTIYLVSKLVAEALHGMRTDLFILSGFTRGPGGKILGGRSFAKLNRLGQ